MGGNGWLPAEEQGVTLSGAVVHRLIGRGNGDAALLYLGICRQKGAPPDRLQAELGWNVQRLEEAAAVLRELKLLGDGGAEVVPMPGQQPAPDYSREEISRAAETDERFAGLLREAERRMGVLSMPSVSKLLALYEEVGLPAGVICQLIVHCCQQAQGQNGAGRVTMSQIYKEGCYWARQGILSGEKADAYLREYARRKAALPRYGAVLGLEADRRLSPSEERYLIGWEEMGFPPETVAIAYDKTILNCQKLKWPYLNGILKRWQAKGLFTPEQVQGEGRKKPAPAPAAAPASGGKNAWMREYTKK